MGKFRKTVVSLLLGCSLLVGSVLGGGTASAAMANGGAETAYKAATEGMVLLKNQDKVLPIQPWEKVSVFGRTQIDTVKGGTGSGNVTPDYRINILQGLRNRGDIQINEDLAALYTQFCTDNPSGEGESGSLGNMGGNTSYPEMPLTDAIVQAARAKSDKAIVTIGRICGEGADRRTTSTDDLGDYYLSGKEEKMLQLVTQYFDKVAVVVNAGAIMDMNWMNTYAVDSVLMMWQAGMEQGNAVADILSGKVNPSGKLVDTIAYNYADYASSANFGMKDPVYQEDVYVGYRYFETFNVPVQFEFGFGLSYTSFKQDIVSCTANDQTVTTQVKITNIGTVAGKEVAEVYYGAPQGLLGKPAKALAAFAKTHLLKPGESQLLTLTYKTADMASYDDGGKIQKSAYVMEAGNYDIYVGNSVKNVTKAGTYSLAATKVTQQLTQQMAPEVAFNRLKADGTYESAPTRTAPRSAIVYAPVPAIPQTGDKGYKLIDVYNGTRTMDEFVAQFSIDDLAKITSGLGMDLVYPPFFEIHELPDDCTEGSAGGYGYMLQYGIPAATVADGPAGVRIDKSVNGGTTAFPIGTLIACTWNEQLMEEVGAAVGNDCVLNKIDGWLAPALNIHRSPLCGRNFEYYSEDPVISGTTAAAVTRGVQSKGVGVTLKHFAANNQETNRMDGNSIVSERALREIYLRAFEIAVRTSNPWYMMTSYNFINGSHAASNYELCTNVLRNEWGFVGTVMTDWTASKDNGDASMIRAQNDLTMPGGMLNATTLKQGYNNGLVTLGEIQRSAKNILNSMMKTLAFGRANNLSNNGAYTAPAHGFTATAADAANAIQILTNPIYVNENFTVKVPTALDVKKLQLMNSNGGSVTIKSATKEVAGNSLVWTIQTAVGTIGNARTFTVVSTDANGTNGNNGTFTVNILPPVSSIQSAGFSNGLKTTQVNVATEVTVVTDKNATSVSIKNASGSDMGKSLVSKTAGADGTITWKYTIKIGTAGSNRGFYAQVGDVKSDLFYINVTLI